MTAYLASLGHRRIAYLCGPADNVLEHERIKGYRDGLRGRASPVSPASDLARGLHPGGGVARRVRSRGKLRAADRGVLLQRRDGDRAHAGARCRRRAVPDEMSVAGFDDIEFAALVQPSLTTVRQPRRDIGRTGALVLVDLLQGRSAPPLVRLKTELVVRASTAASRN